MLGHALDGASVAYFSPPALPDRVQLCKNFVDACINHGIQYAIILSVIGTDNVASSLPCTTYQRQFAEIEAYAKSKQGSPVKLKTKDKGQVKFQPIILRTAPFYQNFYASLAGISSGELYYPLGQYGVLAHTAVDDIGKVIAFVCADPEKHAGKIYNLIGEYQPGNMIASNLAMSLGVTCKYFDVDDDTAVMAFTVLGMQPWIAEATVETVRWFRSGHGQNIDTSDIKTITGDASLRFQKWTKEHMRPLINP